MLNDKEFKRLVFDLIDAARTVAINDENGDKNLRKSEARLDRAIKTAYVKLTGQKFPRAADPVGFIYETVERPETGD